MRIIIASLVVIAALGVTGIARAQADDRAYCESLYELWESHATVSKGHVSAGFEARALVDQCRKGNTAAGIAGLEKKLKDNRFTLPARG